MNKKCYVGIDIGMKGGIALLNHNRELIDYKPISTIQVLINSKKRKKYDLPAINQLIKKWNSENNIIMAGMERMKPIPKQSSQTGFSLGGGSMLFKELFTILNISFVEIEPQNWQKDIFKSLGIQYNKKTLKQASIQATKQLFPTADLRPTERCKKDNDGISDAILIAEYIRKQFK